MPVQSQSAEAFLTSIADAGQRADAQTLAALMTEVSGASAVLWGSGIVGFGDYHYHYASGRQGDTFKVGFAPRKQQLVLYLTCGLDALEPQLERLGSYRAGKGCLYVKRLADVDAAALRELVASAVARLG
jgi:hypothetical protein